MQLNFILFLLLLSQSIFAQVPLRHEYIITKKLDVDNIQIDGNSIVSTNSNGDITITPNGSGFLKTDNLQFWDYVIQSTGSNPLFLSGGNNVVYIPNTNSLVVGNSSPTSGTIFEVVSTEKASIPAPKMTTAQRNLISSAAGKMVYNTDTNTLQINNGTNWSTVGTGSGSSGINYIENYGAEEAITGWSTFNENLTYSSVNTTNDRVTFNESLLIRDSMPILYTNAGGTPIGGLTSGVIYYASTTNTATTAFRLRSSPGGAEIDLTSSGSGTHTFELQDPSVGAGGTANVTYDRTTSSTLAGDGSFQLIKDANNRKRQGFATDFTIDNAQKAKVLTITFDYIVESGTFANGTSNVSPGDIVFWIIDLTNYTLIQPSTIYLGSNSTTISGSVNSTFQTASNSTSYRLIGYINSTSASAYTLKFDNFVIGPSKYVYGTPITDWVDFPSVAAGTLITATTTAPSYGNSGSPVTNKAQWRRVGSNMEIRWDYRHSNTTGAGAGSGMYLFNLPPGYKIDTSKAKANTATTLSGAFADSSVGKFQVVYSSITAGDVHVYDNTRLKCLASTNSVGGFVWGSSGYNFATNANMSFSLYASVPILGWSSSVQMSDNSSNRVIGFSANTTTTAATTSTPFIFTSVTRDDVGGYNASTGIYTTPVPGWWNISAGIEGNGTAEYRIYIGGVHVLSGPKAAANDPGHVSLLRYLPASTTIEIRPDSNVTANGVATTNYLDIFLVNGNQTIAASELVAARYYVSSGASTTSSNPINFDTKDFDTHGSVTTGAGVWKFTAQIAGIYQVTPGTYAGATTHGIFLYKNGSLYSQLGNATASTTSSGRSDLIFLNSGDYIQIFPSVTITPAAASPATVGQMNFVNIIRVGPR